MASGNTLNSFTMQARQSIAADSATILGRNGRYVLEFAKDGVDQVAIFPGVFPRHYAGGGVTVVLAVLAKTATSGNMKWEASFERLAAGGQDLDSDGFAGVQTAVGAANAASGKLTYVPIPFTEGAEMASLAIGECFRLKIRRLGTDVADTMTGVAQLLHLEIFET